jgi:hypothetical protein
VKFTSKYIIMEVGCHNLFEDYNLILMVTEGGMHSFRTIGQPLLGGK